MRTYIKKLKVILTLLLVVVAGMCFAQTAPLKLELKKMTELPASALLNTTSVTPFTTSAIVGDEHRLLAFKKGDGYQKTTLVNSNTILARYDQKFTISSNSSVTKNYNVTDATKSGFQVAVTTNRIADTIFAMGKSMAYNSDQPSDTSSYIQKRFTAMVGQTANVTLGIRDTIFDIKGGSSQAVNDTLFAFTGLQNDQLVKGGSLGLTVDYAALQTMKKGYTWVDTTTSAGTNVKNTFWIESKTDKTTTVAFESALRRQYSNSNTNGVYVIDNATGVVLIRQMRSVTTGYQILNNVVYTASRSTASIESCYKIQ
ncbi:hypothetical protein ACFGVS_26260 [Mucilaginibacter sp. AW1-7]|uniref:hypothetical protein n=1 Tax=Mucilaginibacter sp. AW1-7 TaxID=3349874 RepID=UPI003F73FD65